jgi:predicted molibdopterin-dependent oxidoreductase YjgC
MCDEGRYAYHAIDAADRLREPMIREGEEYRALSWDEAIRATAAALKETLERRGPESAAVLASPQMTNEELFHLRLLFAESLKIAHIEYRVPVRQPVYSDDFLITADKNPNSRGAEVLGLAGPGSDQILRACAEGRIHFLYICHHDLMRGYDEKQVVDALAGVEFIAFQGSRHHATTALAHVLLPAAVYAEKEGTFTNIQDRVQRIHAAVPALGESLPDLEILGRLSTALGVSLPPPHPPEVFKAMGERVPAFEAMSYETVGDSGQTLRQD